MEPVKAVCSPPTRRGFPVCEACAVAELKVGIKLAVGVGLTYRGTSLIRNTCPPLDHHRALGIGLLQGPREGLFLKSEVPL